MSSAGRSYTMKEMKAVVDYLVEHKAYGETRGRKMWMDFANANVVHRTWQSLKAVFLKRILPDIHNPYYKLSMDQIRGFREGLDVTKEKNKLEIQTISEDSNSNADNHKDIEKPSTSKSKKEKTTTGEDIKCSKIPPKNRASAETVILDNCYDTAEDIQKVLESDEKSNPNEEKSLSKSMRDLITYSEPLTPMLQEVLDDFATDFDSDSEPKMQIVENRSESDHEIQLSEKEVPQSDNAVPANTSIDKNLPSDDSDKLPQTKIKSLKLRKRQAIGLKKSNQSEKTKLDLSKNSNKNVEDLAETEKSIVISNQPPETVIPNADHSDNAKKTDLNLKVSHIVTQNSCMSTADSLLPNNQEALNKSKKSIENSCEAVISSAQTKKTKKRSNSLEISTNIKPKRKMLATNKQKLVSASDTDVNANKNKFLKSSKLKVDNDKTNNNENLHNGYEAIDENIENPDENTSTANKAEEPTTSKNTDLLAPSQSSQVNPCLKSVSLFAEQFNTNSYIDSEGSDYENKANDKSKIPSEKADNIALDIVNEVVILKSHSESESEENKLPEVKKNVSLSHVLSKSQRNKALANVFGFSSGRVSSNRKKCVSYRKNSSSHYPRHNSSLESSEWTSESESDYVSPPRGRKNRQTRKYLKPQSARILSLEEEGGLFVMYGKKIYPLVKDGKIIKNYLTYLPESDPEEEESFWKLKYVEERKRVEELKKIINHADAIDKDKSPILQSKSPRKLTLNLNRNNQTKNVNRNSVSETEVIPEPIKETKAPPIKEHEKTLKITFAKNNQQVHLEGHWSQLHPVLADVVQIFQKDADSTANQPANPSTNRPAPKPQPPPRAETPEEKPISITSTPVDEEVHEKVSKLETEIFKEIEKIDEEEEVESKENVESNVTKRKRPSHMRKSPTPSLTVQHSPIIYRSPKRQKTETADKTTQSKTTETDLNEALGNRLNVKSPKSPEKSQTPNELTYSKSEHEGKVVKRSKRGNKDWEDEVDNLSVSKDSLKSNTLVTSKRSARVLRKDVTSTETVNTTPSKTKAKKSLETAVPQVDTAHIEDEDTNIRYMFPPSKRVARKSNTNAKEPAKRYFSKIPKIYSSPNLSQNSESTQGYQDSDVSPPKDLQKRKKKLSLSTVLLRNRNKYPRLKRKSFPMIYEDTSSDSTASFHIIVKKTDDECSLKSEEYRSDSYQLLVPHPRGTFKPLEKIDENSPRSDTSKFQTPCDSDSIKESININSRNGYIASSSNANTDGANSSNVSLPLSPELSIVENLSVSQELINSEENHPTLNEIQVVNDITNKTNQNKYLISQVDISMPLMQQECDLHKSVNASSKSDYSLNDNKKSIISESLINKINTVHMEEAPSLSESLDLRLRNLLLESAKKISTKEPNLEDHNVKLVQKKTRSSKRCSTPRKRTNNFKNKPPAVDPVVEEEFMETCSYGGRKSCPPAIYIISADNVNDTQVIDKPTIVKNKPKLRKKKDIIKVKIVRPKSKTRDGVKSPKKTKNASKTSIPTDSGINESTSVLSAQGLDDSVDLIHNHSETCLQANECIGDSVEFIVSNEKSIISINTTPAQSPDSASQNQFIFKDCQDFVPEMFCSNAQDFPNKYVALPTNTASIENTNETVFHSPELNMSINSLITEDLSDENILSQKNNKWYLLSEDETNNTNAGFGTAFSGFGANLKQIFPITCSVPNLSTITESSKDNETSIRPTVASECDSNTRKEFDS